MKQYSVWNGQRGEFDHYVAPGSLREGVFADPVSLPGGNRLGLAPEQASRRLPTGARMVGRGPLPVGMIASRNGASAMGFFGLDGGTVSNVAIWGGLGYLAYRLFGKKR